MSIPTSRDEFKDFCLRTLGAPVLQVNVDDTQVEDRIDQAFYMYQQFHMDATVKMYLKHEVTPSIMHFTGTPSVPFNNNEVIIGQTSNAHGQTVAPTQVTNANAIYMFGTNGPVAFIDTGPTTPQAGDGKPFVEGEVVHGVQSGANATVAPSGDVLIFSPAYNGTFTYNSTITGASGTAKYITGINSTAIAVYSKTGTFTAGQNLTASGANGIFASLTTSGFKALDLGDMDLKYITIPSSIIAITKIFAPFDSRMSADILFDPQSQFNISLLSNFTSNSIIPYVVGRQYQQLLNDTFRGRPGIRFQRHQGRLYVDVNWYSTFQPHQFLIVECYQVLDPDTSPSIWSDRWLQDYTTALIKRQWGQNLSKFGQIQLPGGVVLNGKEMKDEATLEIVTLEERLKDTYELPIDFIVG